MIAHLTNLVSRLRLSASCLVLGAACLVAPVAQAQMFYGPPVLPERAILGTLHSEGFRRLSQPVLNRDVYVLDAVDPYGDPVRIIVSAFSGRIVAAHPQRGGWSGVDRPGGRWGGLPRVDSFDDDEDDDVVMPSQPHALPRAAPYKPPRQAAAPPIKVEPPKTTNPALSPKNPTVVKTSPLAIPREPEAKDVKPPATSVLPGTRNVPRVIPMAPATATPPVATPAQPRAATLPPPAMLDDGGLSSRPSTPQVPPAPLE